MLKPPSPVHPNRVALAGTLLAFAAGFAGCHLVGGLDDYVDEAGGAGSGGDAAGGAGSGGDAAGGAGSGGDGGGTCGVPQDWADADCTDGAQSCHSECGEASATGWCVLGSGANASTTCRESFSCAGFDLLGMLPALGPVVEVLDVAHHKNSDLVVVRVETSIANTHAVRLVRIADNCTIDLSPTSLLEVSPQNLVRARVRTDSKRAYVVATADSNATTCSGHVFPDVEALSGSQPLAFPPEAGRACTPSEPLMVAIDEDGPTRTLVMIANGPYLHKVVYDGAGPTIVGNNGYQVFNGTFRALDVDDRVAGPDRVAAVMSGANCSQLRLTTRPPGGVTNPTVYTPDTTTTELCVVAVAWPKAAGSTDVETTPMYWFLDGGPTALPPHPPVDWVHLAVDNRIDHATNAVVAVLAGAANGDARLVEYPLDTENANGELVFTAPQGGTRVVALSRLNTTEISSSARLEVERIERPVFGHTAIFGRIDAPLMVESTNVSAAVIDNRDAFFGLLLRSDQMGGPATRTLAMVLPALNNLEAPELRGAAASVVGIGNAAQLRFSLGGQTKSGIHLGAGGTNTAGFHARHQLGFALP